MSRPSYLTKRGNIFWWRRRPPCALWLRDGQRGSYSGNETPSHVRPAIGHLAVSLRTSCRREARRRAARVSHLFEHGWRQFELTMDQHPSQADSTELRQVFAQQILDILRATVEQTARLSEQLLPAPRQDVAQQAIDAAGLRQIASALPAHPSVPPSGSLDDPAFEAALMDMAEREGWWHDKPEEIIEQFDSMLVGLITLQEEYVKYCARKGLDPATALPSLSRLAAGLSGVADAVGQSKSLPAAKPYPSVAPGRPTDLPEPPSPTSDGPGLLEFSTRYLNLRSEGYELKKRNEHPDAKAGNAFRANSRRNIEASVKLFIDLFGDLPVAAILPQHAAEYVGFLERIPATHGKSAKDRRPLRQVIEDSDRDERVSQDRVGAQMRKDGRSPGEIEEAVAAARIERLRTNTCVRHMREFARMLDFAVLDGRRQDNPMRDRMWTTREIARRTSRETEGQRTGWGDDIHALLASSIYRQPLPEPGEPLFWAPLLGIFAGLRMEEALQLRTDDFTSEDGIPFIAVQVGGGEQRLKKMASRRRVPLHRSLIDLGLNTLVDHRRVSGQTRVFTFLERGQSKGTLSEVFSKRFTHYRKTCGLYDERRDFHALRTEFQTRLTRAEVPEHSRKALMGHAISDITHGHYYRAGDTIAMLKRYVDRIDIDTSGVLRPTFGTA